MKLVDTHCHIHDMQYDWPDDVLEAARKNSVTKMITVGTDVEDSKNAIKYAGKNEGVFATIGIHPGTENITISRDVPGLEKLIISSLHGGALVGFGDIGLDYFYKPFDRAKQIKLLEAQLYLATKYDLPVSFHVREAYEDFWSIFDNFKSLRGTLHCYTDGLENMKKALNRDLYISVNGISTFNKEPELNNVFEQIPIDKLLFETDAPYLAPVQFRGKTNQPAYILDICNHWTESHCLIAEDVAKITTENASRVFML